MGVFRHLTIGSLALSCLVSVARAAPPLPDDHNGKVSLYAAATVSAEIAEQRCDGVARNAQSLTDLKYYAGVFAADRALLDYESYGFRADIDEQYAKLGNTAWCDSVWKAFGPEGDMVRDVLIRKNPPLRD